MTMLLFRDKLTIRSDTLMTRPATSFPGGKAYTHMPHVISQKMISSNFEKEKSHLGNILNKTISEVL